MWWDSFIHLWYYLGWRYAWEESWRRAGYSVSYSVKGTVFRYPGAIKYIDLI